MQEQGTKGTSPLIAGNYEGYEGYYNYFNVGASGKSNAEVVQSGLKKAKEKGWNTRYKSLSGGAYVIGANYILKGQDTLYLEKFNVSGGYYANFTHQYMQNIMAPNSEASGIRKAYNNAGALENSFVFKIPVYNNMPASACSKPGVTDTITMDKSTVNDLEVGKTVRLTPYVNGSKVDYISNMTFSSDDTSVATVDSSGKVTAVSPGSVVISCTGSSGSTAVCTVTVVKADPNVSTPTLSPCTYKEGLRLADISLPKGWTWVKENTKIGAGTHSYEAYYTPDDTEKYRTVTKNIEFTVTKGIPSCTMPEEPRVFAGTKLGDIKLPSGFVWESDAETELQEPAGTGQSTEQGAQAGNKAEKGKSEITKTEQSASQTEEEDQTQDSQQDEQAQEAEEKTPRPSVTMTMEDTTILTPESLQMAKEQNLDLLLTMGQYARWSIDIDSVRRFRLLLIWQMRDGMQIYFTIMRKQTHWNLSAMG